MNKRHLRELPVILVDDEEEVLFSSSVLLKTFGITDVVTMEDGRDLLPFLRRKEAGVVVLDLVMPHVSGVELLMEMTQTHPEVPVVVMTASQEVEMAVTCMKEGAFDYLVKPVEESRYVSSVRRALEVRLLRRQVEALRGCIMGGSVGDREAFAEIVTTSAKMEQIFQYVEALGDSSEPVLIVGETGVGKGLIAKAIHMVGGLPGELVSVNVAGLDDAMFSDTLFGHRRGAYSGAQDAREGLVAQAGDGTLFLDEIGDLRKSSQVKLLRLLQEKNYYPLGSDMPRVSNARVVAATNQDLRKQMEEGRFRQDLFFRLSGHMIEVPPFRERMEDAPLLVARFLEEAAQALDKPVPEPPAELFPLLGNYHFPGNIRELRAMVFDAVTRHKSGPVVGMKSFKQAVRAGRKQTDVKKSEEGMPLDSTVRAAGRFPTLKEAENLLIKEALRQTQGNQGLAALLLGVSRPALNRRIMRLKEEAAL